eukprot:gene9844-11557_t
MAKAYSFFMPVVGMQLVVVSIIAAQFHSLPNLQASANIPASEMNAMYDLYNSTNGKGWRWHDALSEGIPWNFSDTTLNNPCVDRWQGVNCNFSSPFENYHVIELSLTSYNLIGTLPATLVSLTQLQTLALGVNRLTGTIPDSLGNLTQLQFLDLSGNRLTNIIPASLGKLIQLQAIALSYNRLHGTIPSPLCNLLQLQIIELETNLFSGTIPAALSNLTQLLQLQFLTFQSNRFTGIIPEILSELPQLLYLELENNRLTGTIPASLGNLTHLQQLYLNNNQLTGTIPASLENCKQLLFLLLFSNQLVGTIPASLGSMTHLQYLDVDTNQLTGTIPESLGNLTQLLFLNLDKNQLTGSIPETLGYLPQLQNLMVHTNHLTGTIPYLDNPNLEQLLLYKNHLSGRVPTLAQFVYLQVVLLDNNQLTGTWDKLFDPSTQLLVATIVLANNQFTGSIPEAVFQLKPRSFVGTSNCFQGPLPIAAICNNMNMVSFVIDGMSSAASCRSKLFVEPLSAYLLDHSIGGSIPQCLFQLPQLTTLHLSGNGFTGSIPNNTQLYESLMDLSLSHNALTGTIPDHIQLKQWKNIDLSYNRLSGILLSHFAANGSIGLENNRISGAIPAPFNSLQNISILESNTFECEYDKSNLPEHDPNIHKYQCGSNSFNALYYTWLGAVFCAVVLVACSVSYGTQTYEYAYQVSGVYMSGVVPFALDWFFWWALLLVRQYFKQPDIAVEADLDQMPSLELRPMSTHGNEVHNVLVVGTDGDGNDTAKIGGDAGRV